MPPINSGEMESQSRPQNQRVFRTLHLRQKSCQNPCLCHVWTDLFSFSSASVWPCLYRKKHPRSTRRLRSFRRLWPHLTYIQSIVQTYDSEIQALKARYKTMNPAFCSFKEAANLNSHAMYDQHIPDAEVHVFAVREQPMSQNPEYHPEQT